MNNTFDNKKGYVLVINQNNSKSKGDEVSTARKYIASEISVSDNMDNIDKINKSIC